MVSIITHGNDVEPFALWPAEAYQFDWNVGKGVYIRNGKTVIAKSYPAHVLFVIGGKDIFVLATYYYGDIQPRI